MTSGRRATTVVQMRTFGSLFVLVAALALAGCGDSTDEASPTTPSSPTETQPTDPGREQAPAVAGETLAGEAIALGDFDGRPVLVNVWSSW